MKVYIESLGCAKNQVDAEVMLKQLSDAGHSHTEDVSAADVIIVNTCGFIESAREQSISAFFSLHKANPKAKIILSGCLAQRYGDTLHQELPEAAAIFGNRDLKEITQVVTEVLQGKRIERLPEYPDPDNEAYQRKELLNFPGSAFLKISEGCNHWCSYCAIPLIRGELRSRPMDMVVQDARELIRNGVCEINVVAQDLAAYGLDWDGRSHLRELLEHLVKLDGDFRLRMLYIHPDFFPDWLPQFVKDNSKLIPYFDIPLQHAAPEVLKLMGRFGNPDIYLKLINDIRTTLPDAMIRTTIMVGFPGEEPGSFKILKEFLRKARFDWMGVFVYSREEGTKAYGMRDEAEHEKAQRRAKRYKNELENLQGPITEERLQRFVGNTYDVLIEEQVIGEDLAIGRIYSQAPDVDGLTVVMGHDLRPGTVYKCGIKSVKGLDLEAVVVE
ncbi:MAG: 30S ribosomal protein S12 methylthiotransferase RimO [Sphaerochaetaceae bacterium]